ncbi:hypothetical protein MNBD_ALPHA06-1726 [hydrothermal vent metagenome]|uniref:LysM domain-containing protein n=1 Tax=hydrothermal vent metagenome TaxID=652676 RepID=A0A3B0RLN2_9ZZZZ
MSTLRGFIIAATVTSVAAITVLLVLPSSNTPKPVPNPVGPATISVQEQVVRSAPAFDIVRIDVSGTAVVAGTAEPGAKVTLMSNEQSLATAIAGSDGAWSMVITEPLPVGDMELYLIAKTTGGQDIRSKHVVVVSIPENRERLPLVVLGAPGGASRVLQDPDQHLRSGDLTLETIDYDREGGVIFAGQAKPGLTVRVLHDGKEVGETRADENGRWSMTSQVPLAVGLHELQIDQVENTGRVSAVLALPFERADPALAADVAPGSVIVQPGASLWRIARKLYGQGTQYTLIYSANQEHIRDPNLIYPGQVFAIPAEQAKNPEKAK